MPILGVRSISRTQSGCDRQRGELLGIDLVDVISAIEDAPQIPGRMEKVNLTPGGQPLSSSTTRIRPKLLNGPRDRPAS